jgi:predicted RNA-binding Zn ribbon-like protein
MSWTGQMATDEEHRAPGRLELVRAFVNTLDVEEGTDGLADERQAAEWASEWELPVPVSSTAEREQLVSLREALRRLMLANNAGERPPPPALAELNRQAEAAAIGLRFDPDGSALVTRCDGADATIAAVLARVHEAMAEGTWARLKVCPAGDCLWAFYDHSRNRSGTWCEMGVCGNRAKARAFRERRRGADAQ